MEIIKVNIDSNGKQAVNARDLYNFLEVKTDFSEWCKRMFSYGFEEHIDFTPVLGKSTGGRPSIDYALNLDCAKEISMIQRTERGKQARLYFISCEKQLNAPKELSRLDLAQMVVDSEKEKELLALQIANDAPKVIFADAVSVSNTCILVGELAKIIKQNGIDIGANRLFDWLRENSYLISRNGSDRNMPTQKSMDLGLFEIKETIISHSDGHTSINKTPKVTGKGQLYFINKFLNN